MEGAEVESLSVILNDTVTLHCAVHGIPMPNITWLADGHPLNCESHTDLLFPVPYIHDCT